MIHLFLIDSITGHWRFSRRACPEATGRDAVHPTRQGFAATAVDSSRVGLAKAVKLAHEFGVSIQTVTTDLADYVIEEGVWDTIKFLKTRSVKLSIHHLYLQMRY